MAIRSNISYMSNPPKSRFNFSVDEEIKTPCVENTANTPVSCDFNEIRLLKVREVAECMSVTKKKVYELIDADLIVATKIGSLRIAYEDVVEFQKKFKGKDVDKIIEERKAQKHMLAS